MILILAFLMVGFHSDASELILDFSNGNQIYGSQLSIFDDGRITHDERTCCPPRIEAVSEESLSPKKLFELQQWIRDAFTGSTAVTEGMPTAEGSESGFLRVFAEGSQATIHEIERNNQADGKDRVTRSLSKSAPQIEQLVDTYVEHPLKKD